MKKTVFLIVTIITIVGLLEAGSKNRRGTAGAQELMIPNGSQATAMAGAYVAGISGIEAVEWNVAGVSGMSTTGEAMFSQTKWLADITISSFGIASSVGGRNIFGINLKSMDFGKIPVTTYTETEGTGEFYSPAFFNIAFLYARKMTDRINFGADVRFISESIINENAKGATLDAGVQYHAKPNGLHLGVSLKNLGLNMVFNGSDLEQQHQPVDSDPGTPNEWYSVVLQSFEMPTTLELGTSYGPIDFGAGKLVVAASFLNNNFSFDEYRFGAEFNALGLIYLRSGITIGYDPEPYGEDNIEDTEDDGDDQQYDSKNEEFIWGPAFGFGLDLSQVTGMGISVDYSYRTTYIFDGVSWLTFKVAF